MNHTYCENGYCGAIKQDHTSDNKVSSQDKIRFAFMIALLLAVTGAIVFYGASQGIYVDLGSLN